jgi:hypothetical protein
LAPEDPEDPEKRGNRKERKERRERVAAARISVEKKEETELSHGDRRRRVSGARMEAA